MDDDLARLDGGSRPHSWLIIAAAIGGAAAIYFFSTERGRKWLRELPELGKQYAATTRQAMVTLREITDQVERAVGTVEQALDQVGETLAARDTASAGTSRNGGEHRLMG